MDEDQIKELIKQITRIGDQLEFMNIQGLFVKIDEDLTEN